MKIKLDFDFRFISTVVFRLLASQSNLCASDYSCVLVSAEIRILARGTNIYSRVPLGEKDVRSKGGVGLSLHKAQAVFLRLHRGGRERAKRKTKRDAGEEERKRKRTKGREREREREREGKERVSRTLSRFRRRRRYSLANSGIGTKKYPFRKLDEWK